MLCVVLVPSLDVSCGYLRREGSLSHTHRRESDWVNKELEKKGEDWKKDRERGEGEEEEEKIRSERERERERERVVLRREEEEGEGEGECSREMRRGREGRVAVERWVAVCCCRPCCYVGLLPTLPRRLPVGGEG